MALVQQQDPEAHLEIIGDGPLRAELEILAKKLAVCVHFRGVQDTHEVRRAMSRARILCNPSVTAATGDMEGFGMVFAEAQSVGTPVVSSRHGAIPEAVSDGETGLLCPERIPGPLAEALLIFLKDQNFWDRASARSIMWVRERFDIGKQTAKLDRIYDECRGQYSRDLADRRGTRPSMAPPQALRDIQSRRPQASVIVTQLGDS
jgi:glycosyltransferase involved in cell wall biosynthesis